MPDAVDDGILALLDAIEQRLRGVLWGQHEPFVCSHESTVSAEVGIYASTGGRWCLFYLGRDQLVEMTATEAEARARTTEKMLTANRHDLGETTDAG